MEHALRDSHSLVGQRFSMADIAMAPYVNRLAALSLAALWEHGRLPRVARWFDNVRARPTFGPAFVDWLPAELAAEMRANGRASWPAVAGLLGVALRPGDTSPD
jgi:glutathione S-transferase